MTGRRFAARIGELQHGARVGGSLPFVQMDDAYGACLAKFYATDEGKLIKRAADKSPDIAQFVDVAAKSCAGDTVAGLKPDERGGMSKVRVSLRTVVCSVACMVDEHPCSLFARAFAWSSSRTRRPISIATSWTSVTCKSTIAVACMSG